MDLPPIEELASYGERINKFDGYRGNVIGLWACIESGIDRANHYAWWYSKKEVAERVPVSLGRKIKLFKEVNRDLLPFEPLREYASKLAQNVDELYEDRHWLAHGYLLPNEAEGDTWVVEKNVFPKGTGGLNTARRTFTQRELEELRLKLTVLATYFSGYLRALATQVEKHA